MKILQIIPGSGGSFYCGNCLRDSKYVDALRVQGHEVLKIPMYLPLFADEHDISDVPVFYGAVSIYLKQLYPIFRKAPPWFDKLLNSKAILKLAAGFSGSTNARGLEEMTVSMLLGEEGMQKEELDRMVDWISGHYKPDIIHISNALLLGLAKKLKERLNTPIVCSLQDEDTWVDVMDKSFSDKVWELMEDRSADVDAFIAVSDNYMKIMQKKMKIPAEKLHRVYIGVDPGDYEYCSPEKKSRTIGFISRACHQNGLDILAAAFISLREKPGFEDVTLAVTGGHTAADNSYIKGIKRKITKAGLSDAVVFHKDFEGTARMDFFRKVSVISVPVREGEAFGIYLLESMGSGIPVVQPAVGAFPEIVKAAGGGILYDPNTPSNLADVLARLLSDKELLEKLSVEGRRAVEMHFDIHQHTSEMVEIYQKFL